MGRNRKTIEAKSIIEKTNTSLFNVYIEYAMNTELIFIPKDRMYNDRHRYNYLEYEILLFNEDKTICLSKKNIY